MRSTRDLVEDLAAVGEVTAIVLRPGRRVPATTVTTVDAVTGRGLVGDRHHERSRTGGRRQVTLFQAEHLPVVASLAGVGDLAATDVRRNLVVSGFNLLAAKGRRLQVGAAVLEVTGSCHPCSRMDDAVGPGGFQAMRGHGGMTARILTGGTITVGDAVTALPVDDPAAD